MPQIKTSLYHLFDRFHRLLYPHQKHTPIELEPLGYAPATPGNKVLLVEEEQDLCTLIKIYLNRINYEVQVTHNGIEGLATAAATKPDIIWVSSTLVAQDPDLPFKLRDAAPNARVSEKMNIKELLKNNRDNNGAKIE
ncbi:response regulator [Paracnuella aquatica]|uniref:response regulator n=1 Tax=Paracnuella aquatica TaxID=2268757 RepID=UPI000F5007E8|nr:response regulator [Paracnuella aquatica]RPD48101.1 response regulator [Paracnuella aquatica]